MVFNPAGNHNTAHFACLPYLTHLFQIIILLGTELRMSRKYTPVLWVTRTRIRNDWFKGCSLCCKWTEKLNINKNYSIGSLAVPKTEAVVRNYVLWSTKNDLQTCVNWLTLQVIKAIVKDYDDTEDQYHHKQESIQADFTRQPKV